MKATIVACGTPLATRIDDIAKALRQTGWTTYLATTTAAERWTSPQRPDRAARRPDLLVVCPMTFNTTTAWAQGRSDTPILGLLNESLGRPRTRTLAVPFVNTDLAGHPAYAPSLTALRAAGVILLDPLTGSTEQLYSTPTGQGDSLAAAFNPAWIVTALTCMTNPHKSADER